MPNVVKMLRRSRRLVALATLFVLSQCSSVLGAVSPKRPIPWGGFRLDWKDEIVILAGIFLCAAVVWLLLYLGRHIVPGLSYLARTVILMPIIEEYLFRYLGMYLLFLGGKADPAMNSEIGMSELVRAFIYVGVFFGILHVFLTLKTEQGLFTPPPVIPVCEGLYIGMFNGLMFLNFVFLFRMGLFVTMCYVWMAHILVNAGLVIYNFFVNSFLGRSLLAHLMLRLVLAATAVFWFWYCWRYQTITTIMF